MSQAYPRRLTTQEGVPPLIVGQRRQAGVLGLLYSVQSQERRVFSHQEKSFGGVNSPRNLDRDWCQLNKPKTVNPHSDSKLEIQAAEMRGEKSVVSKDCTANTGVMKRNRRDVDNRQMSGHLLKNMLNQAQLCSPTLSLRDRRDCLHTDQVACPQSDVKDSGTITSLRSPILYSN